MHEMELPVLKLKVWDMQSGLSAWHFFVDDVF